MITTKEISIFNLLKWTGPHILWLNLLMGSIALLYHYDIIEFKIPWLPVSVIGTAVAFYVGFKITKLMIECGKLVKFGAEMLSLCRVIEIDLKEMLYETDLPPAIQSKDGVLM